jgi:hypothetical protein
MAPGDDEGMKANRVFHLTVTRGGREPSFLAERGRLDRIEVVSIEDGDLLLYWELSPKDATKLLRKLRADLAGMEAEEFLALWEGADT